MTFKEREEAFVAGTTGIKFQEGTDVYFSADIETDGPIPGPFSILTFALVFAGSFDGRKFARAEDYSCYFQRKLRPISEDYDPEALRINGLNRDDLVQTGQKPEQAMEDAAVWVKTVAGRGKPVLVAYPVSFDWSWLYWYFVKFTGGSPFRHSRCFDIKTAIAVKARIPVSQANRLNLLPFLRPSYQHTHDALDDAVEQAEIFARLFEWKGTPRERPHHQSPIGDKRTNRAASKDSQGR